MGTFGSWAVGVVILFIIGLAIRKIYSDYKNGKSCGCGGCSSCPKSNNQPPVRDA